MAELVDRREAIDAIKAESREICYEFGMEKNEVVMTDDAVEALNLLPTVTPEPGWIPCGERMPEEHDSYFAHWYGTKRWNKSMFRKHSKDVLVTTKFKDGTYHVEVGHTRDGKWKYNSEIIPREAVAWMPFPERYKESEGE